MGEDRHTTLDDAALEIQITRHFDRSAETHFTITLGKVHVTHTELGTWDKDGKVDGTTTRKILNVAVSAILAARNGTSTFGGNLVPGLILAVLGREMTQLSKHGSLGFRQARQRTRAEAAAEGLFLGCALFGDQGGLAVVPDLEEFVTRSRSNEARVNETGKADTRKVTARAVDAFNVPNGLGSPGVVVRQEATAVLLGKGPRKAPFVAIETTQSKEFDLEKIARLSRWDINRTREVVAEEFDGTRERRACVCV